MEETVIIEATVLVDLMKGATEAVMASNTPDGMIELPRGFVERLSIMAQAHPEAGMVAWYASKTCKILEGIKP